MSPPAAGRGQAIAPTMSTTKQPAKLVHSRGDGLSSPFEMAILVFLFAFWQLLHSTHAAGTDMDCAGCTINYHMATLYIEYKATASAPLRETHIIAMHGLALTNITTTSHIYSFLISTIQKFHFS